MEFFSAPWLSALLAIVLIDLVLAGDNAIVIALAARRLPPQLQKKAIVWGTVGAIIVRSAMTVGVVWLLKIPGLMLVGGLGLVWVAYKLLVPQEACKRLFGRRSSNPGLRSRRSRQASAIARGRSGRQTWSPRRERSRSATVPDAGSARA